MVQVEISSPTWFFGLDGSFEVIAAVIAIVVAFAAWKIWRMTKERSYGWVCLSFLFIFIGFAARGIADLVIEKVITCAPAIREALPAVPGVSRTALVFLGGYLGNIIFTLAAYIMLVGLSYKVEEKAMILLLFLLTLPILVLSSSYFLSYYWMSTVLLGAITYAYYKQCMQTKRKKGRAVTLAFGFLALAQMQFIVSALNVLTPLSRDILYVTAHSTQILGFLMILFVFVRTMMK